MNDEMKKIISRFLCVSVIIGCMVLLFSGAVTAKQRSEYNSYHTEYAMVRVKSQDSQINVELGEESYSFDLSYLKKLKRYKNIAYFTPLAPAFLFGESIFNIFYA